MKRASLIIHPSELTKKWVDRIADNKIPTLAIHPEGGKQAYEHIGKLLDLLDSEQYRELLDYGAGRGLNIEYEMHAARFLLPESEFLSHPEWFRMNREGKRTTDFNLCASSDEAIAMVAENAAALVKKLYRSTNRYFLWLDDSKDAFCHCPSCSKMSASDQQMKILNAIIKRIREDNPEATLAYLAYCETIEAPRDVAAEEGIFLEYAPFCRDFHRPLSEDGECAHLGGLLDFFDKDSAKALDYWYDNSLFSKWKKPPVFFEVDRAVMEADIEFYRQLGFADVSAFACFLGDDYEELHGEVDVSDFGRLVAQKN